MHARWVHPATAVLLACLLTGSPLDAAGVSSDSDGADLGRPVARQRLAGTDETLQTSRTQVRPLTPAFRVGQVDASSGAGGDELALTLVSAYSGAAAAAPARCELSVSLLAALGEAQSGSLAGVAMDAEHRVSLRGPRGAAGPMQLRPGTWRRFGRDGDGDAQVDVRDLEDAAAGMGAYLCAHGRHLSRPRELRTALLGLHPSAAFVELVRTLQARFSGAGLDGPVPALVPMMLAPARLRGPQPAPEREEAANLLAARPGRPDRRDRQHVSHISTAAPEDVGPTTEQTGAGASPALPQELPEPPPAAAAPAPVAASATVIVPAPVLPPPPAPASPQHPQAPPDSSVLPPAIDPAGSPNPAETPACPVGSNDTGAAAEEGTGPVSTPPLIGPVPPAQTPVEPAVEVTCVADPVAEPEPDLDTFAPAGPDPVDPEPAGEEPQLEATLLRTTTAPSRAPTTSATGRPSPRPSSTGAVNAASPGSATR